MFKKHSLFGLAEAQEHNQSTVVHHICVRCERRKKWVGERSGEVEGELLNSINLRSPALLT